MAIGCRVNTLQAIHITMTVMEGCFRDIGDWSLCDSIQEALRQNIARMRVITIDFALELQ